MKAAGFIISLMLLFISCEKEDVLITSQKLEQLEGYWANRQITDTILTFERTEKLAANQYGVAFLPEGKFIERKNAGWCGTPPIAYADYDGSWLLTDSIVNVSVGYWGGTATYKWQVVFVDNERLSIEVISEEYSQEN